MTAAVRQVWFTPEQLARAELADRLRGLADSYRQDAITYTVRARNKSEVMSDRQRREWETRVKLCREVAADLDLMAEDLVDDA
jgi:hypothetical protein